jgi:hypothetical protein
MKLERQKFLELTAGIAAACAAACGGGASEVSRVGPGNPNLYGPPPTVQTAQPMGATPTAEGMRATGTQASLPLPAAEGASGLRTASCNDVGDPRAACLRLPPQSEGGREECLSLGLQLRPHVAEAWSQCLAKERPGPNAYKTRKACFRAAIESSCMDEEARVLCKTMIAQCAAGKRKVNYTVDQCAKVLSATAAGAEGDWRKTDEERLGYGPTAESCSIEYALPYQPFSPW